MIDRYNAQPISLLAGERTDVAAATQLSSEIRCLSGRLHVTSMHMGIGWTMQAGDACLLRVNTRYRVTARTPARMTLSSPF